MALFDKLFFWRKKETESTEEVETETQEVQTLPVSPSKYHSSFYTNPVICEVCNQKIEGKLKIIKQGGERKYLHRKCFKDLKRQALQVG